MTCFSEKNTAMDAAAQHTAAHSACANSNEILMLDAALPASIFVILSGLVSLLSRITGLLVPGLLAAPRRLKDTHPTFA